MVFTHQKLQLAQRLGLAQTQLADTDNTASMSTVARMSSQRRVSQAPVLARSSSPDPRDVQRQGTRGRIDARAAHTIDKLQNAGISNAGSLTFPNISDKKPAKFAKMPDMKDKASVDKAIDVLTDVWKLPRANVLISVTGGAQVFS